MSFQVPFFFLEAGASNQINETMARVRNPRPMKGRRKWQMKESGWGKVSSEVKQNEKRIKEGRKGKQVELLILVIMFLPGQSISKASYDITKTAPYPTIK